jgi:P-type conjugative transfer protein TrbJ
MKNTFVGRTVAAGLMLGVTIPASAFFGIGGNIVFDPTAVAEAVKQTAQDAMSATRAFGLQVQQYTQAVRDALSLADPVFQPIGDTWRAGYSMYSQGRYLMYTAQNVGNMFSPSGFYPNYNSLMYTMGQGRPMSSYMPAVFQQQTDDANTSVMNGMLPAAAQLEGAAGDSARFKSLMLQANAAVGPTQMAHANVQVGLAQLEAAQRANELLAQDMIMRGNALAEQNRAKAMDLALVQGRKAVPFNNSPAMDF